MMLIICHYNACVLYLTPTMAADDGVRPDYPNGTAREDNAYGPKETLDMSKGVKIILYWVIIVRIVLRILNKIHN